MKKVLAIGASNSSKSINKVFATYVAKRIKDVSVVTADWEDLVLPLYSPDIEALEGIPENAQNFRTLVRSVDAIVLSLAEYNGMPTAAFKNLWDWTSRIDMKFWSNSPMFLMAVSPGGRGGANVLRLTKDLMPHFAGNVITDFSLPFFYENYQHGNLVNEKLNAELTEKIQLFQKSI
ncbi:MAG: NAD(P)H-dependent oxidoreductase [Bacteroidota bacterium]